MYSKGNRASARKRGGPSGTLHGSGQTHRTWHRGTLKWTAITNLMLWSIPEISQRLEMASLEFPGDSPCLTRLDFIHLFTYFHTYFKRPCSCNRHLSSSFSDSSINSEPTAHSPRDFLLPGVSSLSCKPSQSCPPAASVTGNHAGLDRGSHLSQPADFCWATVSVVFLI